LVSAPVIRTPLEDEYPGWLETAVNKIQGLPSPPSFPDLVYMPIPGPYLRRLPVMLSTSDANAEARARRRELIFRSCHPDFWKLDTAARNLFFAAVPSWFSRLETPLGMTSGGCLVAFHARDELRRSLRDPHSVAIALWATEYLVLTITRWYLDAHQGKFWLFSSSLVALVKQLPAAGLVGDDAEALAFHKATVDHRACLPVGDMRFRAAVQRMDPQLANRIGWLDVQVHRTEGQVRLLIWDDLHAQSLGIPPACMAASLDASWRSAPVPLVPAAMTLSLWETAVNQRRALATPGVYYPASRVPHFRGYAPTPVRSTAPPPVATPAVSSPATPAAQLPAPGAVVAPVSTPASSLPGSRVTVSTPEVPSRPGAPTVSAWPTSVLGSPLRMADGTRLPLGTVTPSSLRTGASTHLGVSGEEWLENILGRLPEATRDYSLSAVLFALADVVTGQADVLLIWAARQPTPEFTALPGLLTQYTRNGVNAHFWRLLKVHAAQERAYQESTAPRREREQRAWPSGGAGGNREWSGYPNEEPEQGNRGYRGSGWDGASRSDRDYDYHGEGRAYDRGSETGGQKAALGPSRWAASAAGAGGAASGGYRYDGGYGGYGEYGDDRGQGNGSRGYGQGGTYEFPQGNTRYYGRGDGPSGGTEGPPASRPRWT